MFRILVLTLLLALPAAAQPVPPIEEDAGAPADALGRGTPRGMVDGLIAALSERDYRAAAAYLDLDAIPEAARPTRGADIALALQGVLDRTGRLLPSFELSIAPEGATGDGLPADTDRFAEIRLAGDVVDLLAHRVEGPDGPPIWLVAPDTLALVETVASDLRASLVERWIPVSLRRPEVLGAPVAHWVAMGVIALFSLAIARVTMQGLFLVSRRIWPVLRDGRPAHVGRAVLLPVGLLIACIVFSVATMLVGVSIVARALVGPVVEIVVWIAAGWTVWRAIDAIGQTSLDAMSRRGRLGAVSVVILARRAGKFVIVVLALIAAAGSVGLNLTGWLAALGIGGLAFALGAQKTIEHFVGSLSLIADQPVRVGDFCRVDGMMGTVEDIGMRSTRLRTLDRTLITVPNGTMSQARIENFASRDIFHFAPVLGLVYETTPEVMRRVLGRLRALLRDDPRIRDDDARVRFIRFGPSSLDVEVFCYVTAADYLDFLAIQEELNLAIMDILGDCGTAFAFPSQTLYLNRGDAPPGDDDAA